MFKTLINLMESYKDSSELGADDGKSEEGKNPLKYHIELVQLLGMWRSRPLCFISYVSVLCIFNYQGGHNLQNSEFFEKTLNFFHFLGFSEKTQIFWENYKISPTWT